MSLFQRDGWLLGFPTPFLLFVKEDWINTLQNCSLLTLAKSEESLAPWELIVSSVTDSHYTKSIALGIGLNTAFSVSP